MGFKEGRALYTICYNWDMLNKLYGLNILQPTIQKGETKVDL